MPGKKVAVIGSLSALLVLASGTVGFTLGRDADEASPSARSPAAAPATPEQSTTLGGGAVAGRDDARDVASAAVGFPGPDFPGFPPYGQAPAGDGLHAMGVAFEETKDAGAEPGAGLVARAFQDAEKKARELAAASHVQLGRLVAVSDHTQNQPLYKACVEPLAGSREAPPSDGGTRPEDGGTPTILPAPVPDCSPSNYLVAWVFVRYEIA